MDHGLKSISVDAIAMHFAKYDEFWDIKSDLFGRFDRLAIYLNLDCA